MPQGLGGRVALFGAGVVCCSGLVGCMSDGRGTAPPPVSKAKAGAVTPPGARTTTPDLRPTGGTGIPVGGGFQPGVNQAPPATPNYTGGISGQVPPGNYGPGAPIPGQNPPIVPSLTPPPSNYPPAGATVPAGYGSSNVGAVPTTARAAAPAHPTPPVAPLTDMPIQPPAPPMALTAEVPVPTAPANVPGPLAPPLPPGGIR